MTKTLMHLMIVAGMLTSAGAHAIAIEVDGDLADWGVKRNGNASDWTPTPNKNIQFIEEDQHSSYLDPGYGGQDYDAEAIYALIQGNTLFIALATGHNPNTLNDPINNSYGAGDFAIDFGRDGTYELGINIKLGGDTFGDHKGVYTVDTWDYGLWDDKKGYVKSEHPTSIISGTKIGDAVLAISEGQKGYGQWTSQFPNDDHYFYEMSIDLSLLTSAKWNKDAFNIHWTQNCANDSIIVDPPSVPEPGTMALLPLGLLGLIALRRRKAASAA